MSASQSYAALIAQMQTLPPQERQALQQILADIERRLTAGSL